MPRIDETRVVPYTPAQMFDLVADVASYPEFLPWTAAARIRSRDDRGDHEVMEADLVVGFKGFRESFGSRVRLYPEARRIETEYLDGPFRHLRSEWSFAEHPRGCEVRFWVEFEFRNPILRRVIGAVFDEAMRRIIGAFEARARKLYGAAGSASSTA